MLHAADSRNFGSMTMENGFMSATGENQEKVLIHATTLAKLLC
jgi:hypothetical protein